LKYKLCIDNEERNLRGEENIQGHVLIMKVSQHCVQKQVKPHNVTTLQADIKVPK